MARRTNQRRDAVFALYQSDLTGRGLDDLLGRSSSEYTRALAHATEDYSEELDDLIGRHADPAGGRDQRGSRAGEDVRRRRRARLRQRHPGGGPPRDRRDFTRVVV